jgi:hypothetical protein
LYYTAVVSLLEAKNFYFGCGEAAPWGSPFRLRPVFNRRLFDLARNCVVFALPCSVGKSQTHLTMWFPKD